MFSMEGDFMLAAIILCITPIATDGDTLRCASGDRVRIYGIQAPEIGKPGAEISKINLQALVRGGVSCVQKGTSYNRKVGICHNRSGQDVGREQIRRGVAYEWCKYSRNRYGGCR
jgi:endonuclease YncB( thermonuclease family)